MSNFKSFNLRIMLLFVGAWAGFLSGSLATIIISLVGLFFIICIVGILLAVFSHKSLEQKVDAANLSVDASYERKRLKSVQQYS